MKFKIPEISNDLVDIDLNIDPHSELEDIFINAARIYYWTMNGWKYAWPLYFELHENDTMIKADVYIVSNEANLILEVILK